MKLKPVFENIVVDNRVIASVELSPVKFPKPERPNDKNTRHFSR